MTILSDDLSGIKGAENLLPEDAATVARLVDTFNASKGRNRSLMRFYEDKNEITWLGLAVPAEMASRIGARTGWAAKSVDYLASRSILDGFTSRDEEVEQRIQAIMQRNRMTGEYAKAVTSELVYGCGFWTIAPGEKGEPPVVINYHNATSATAIMDYRRKRVKAGMVIEDYMPESATSTRMIPCTVVVHMDDRIITIERDAKMSPWKADYAKHVMGRPLMEAMCYRPTDVKMGKSRISPAVQDCIVEAQREMVRMAFSSEAAAQPMRYALGLDPEAIKGKDKLSLAYNAFLTISKDEDGDVPTIGQLDGASPEPHIKVMEHLMNRMSGETGIPVSSFGLSSNGYTSADALRASSDDLILEAEALCRTNGESLVNVAKMALAMERGVPMSDLTEEEHGIAVHWVDPSMPSTAAMSDAMTKQAAVVDWLTSSEVYWEKLGYSEEERIRLMADMRRNRGRMTTEEVLEVARNGRP